MTTFENLARLVAASEDLVDSGMVNLQKLLEALVYSAVRVEARAHRRGSEPAQRIKEIASIVDGFPDRIIPSDFREVLKRSLQRYTADPTGDLTYGEAPDIFVCRSCGNAAVSSAPRECPFCQAASGVFRRFQGMFNGDNAEPEDPSALIDLLEDNARQLKALLSGLNEADCLRRPFDGHWCIREHVTHFLDAQAVLIQRVALILKEDTPMLSSAAPYETATNPEGRPAETREILKLFLSDRRDLTTRLRALNPSQLWKRGRHDDFGLVSIMHQVKYFGHHEQAHMGSITVLRKAVKHG
jgi:rubrerythrin